MATKSSENLAGPEVVQEVDPEADLVARELRAAILRVSRRLRKEVAQDGVTSGQLAVLASLTYGPQTPRQLADREQVRPPWMTRTVAALAEMGLVTREDDPTDGRQVLVSLAPAGRAFLDETRRRRTEWLSALLGAVEPEEREVLGAAARILLRMTE